MTSAARPAGPLTVRKATTGDIPVILDIYREARAFMRTTGNLTQWPDTYPSLADIEADLQEQALYVCTRNNEVLAVFYLVAGPDPTYEHIEGAWLDDEPYHVVHRIAARAGSHAGRHALTWACNTVGNLRIDTHEDNAPMRRLLTNLGFEECGTIVCNDGTPRVAYQRRA